MLAPTVPLAQHILLSAQMPLGQDSPVRHASEVAGIDALAVSEIVAAALAVVAALGERVLSPVLSGEGEGVCGAIVLVFAPGADVALL